MPLTTTSPKQLRSASKKKSSSGTPTASGKGKSEKQGNATPAATYLCVTCSTPVNDGEKGLSCDFCGKYTHLMCDGKLSADMYTALENNADNSLLYFCIDCRPMLVPKNIQEMWKGFLGNIDSKIDKAISKQHEPLAEKIMNKLSAKITELDGINREHMSNMAKVHETVQQLESQSINRQEMAEHMRKIDTLLKSSQSNHRQPQPAWPPMPSNQATSDIPSLMSIPDTRPPRQVYEHVPPGPMSQPPVPNRAPLHRQPPPTLSHDPNENVVDPANTIVVYNFTNNRPVYMNVEQLMLKCNMPRTDVTKGDHLYRPRNERRPPIFITCSNFHSKYKFLREINKLRATDNPEYESIYARPFMSAEDLRKDRELVRRLKETRSRHQEKTLKIYKGEIYEVDGINFRPYLEPESTEAHNIEELKEQVPAVTAEPSADSVAIEGNGAQQRTEGTDAQNNDA